MAYRKLDPLQYAFLEEQRRRSDEAVQDDIPGPDKAAHLFAINLPTRFAPAY